MVVLDSKLIVHLELLATYEYIVCPFCRLIFNFFYFCEWYCLLVYYEPCVSSLASNIKLHVDSKSIPNVSLGAILDRRSL